jgi:hypothetical protein
VSVRKRLARLEERATGEERQPRSPEHVYERIREEARESIAESLTEGDEPLYRIAENGDVETTDGRAVNHYGDFIGELDRRIAKLDTDIEEEIVKERSKIW